MNQNVIKSSIGGFILKTSTSDQYTTDIVKIVLDYFYKKLRIYYKNLKKPLKIFIFLSVLLAAILLLYYYPIHEVSKFRITNSKDLADLENSYRVTLAQILGGVAVGISLYYTHKRVSAAEKSVSIAQKGQITERFTRAVDQLGNRAPEIRLGGIYALERISTESEDHYWPIMEILTAYVRINSSVEVVENKKNTNLSMDVHVNESTNLPFDIQAVLTVLRRRKYAYNNGESNRLNLSNTYLNGIDISGANFNGANLNKAKLHGAKLKGTKLSFAHLEGAELSEANLERADLFGAKLNGANLKKAKLIWTNLQTANLRGVNLERADLTEANLKPPSLFEYSQKGAFREEGVLREGVNLLGANLKGASLAGARLEDANLNRANLEEAELYKAHLEGALLFGTNLEKAKLYKAHLEGAQNLSFDQLSNVKTLYGAKLEEDLLIQLKEKCPILFEEPYEYKNL